MRLVIGVEEPGQLPEPERDPVRLVIADDHVVDVVGDSPDAQMMRGHYAAWAEHEGHRGAYAVSHVGWGLHTRCRWESLLFYDKADTNGTELRAVAGNFLYSTGANEVAGRWCVGHFDLPMRHCTVRLDGTAVVVDGRLVD